jgi:hypothetical protein
MGKMKGNRLNTAANVGTFVSSRQQLKQQKQIASNTGQMSGDMNALLQIQQKQAQEADYDRLLARMDRAVAEGRLTRDEADTATELEWFNRHNPAPKADARIMPTVGASIKRGRDTPSGWYTYRAPGASFIETSARYWSGSGWTMETLSLDEATKLVRDEWRAANPHVLEKRKSRVTAGVLGILLGSLGVHRFYLGSIGIGMLQVFLFLGLIFFGAFWLVTIWGIVEGIMILRGAKAFERDFRTDLPLL